MIDYFESIIVKYSNKGLIIDTNLFLLLVIGTANQNRIESFKRTSRYLIEDYKILSSIVSNFNILITTPNILTEVSNLLNHLDQREKLLYYQYFDTFIRKMNENFIKSNKVSSNNLFSKFGLTDLSIFEVSKGSYLVLTDDLELYHYLSNKKIDVINFNHLRIY